jgi:signal transduction histidine kinase
MLESLRARLLIWHTAIVTAVVAIFGGTICFLVWRTGVADVDAALEARAAVLSNALSPAGRGTFDLTLAPADAATGPIYHALWTREGSVIDWTDEEDAVPPPTSPGTRMRAGRRELTVHSATGAVVLVGRHLDDLRAEVWSLAALLLAVGGAVLAFSLVAGSLFAGRALAPITRISGTARQMAQGDLSARIPIERVETELGQVARALNGAFDRLQASLDRQRRLTADVSHELRTPVATVSAEAQWALARERDREEYRESLAVCQRAAGRMQAIVERLLTLARTEAASNRDVVADVALDDVVRRAVAEVARQAASRGLAVTVDAEPVVVSGDPERILEAITNVVANAIAYNVTDGSVSVTLRERGGTAEVTVADTGVGILPGDLPLIFDPFFRADQARSRDAGGAGLGLSLTRSIVERLGGSVRATSEPGVGTQILIRLPVATPSAPRVS